MREIKFRAWDKKNKRMAEVYTLGLSGIEYSTINSGGELLSGCGKNDIELMQFTGILDKNGVKIYEGDLIIHNTKIKGIKPVFTKKPVVVEWNQEKAQFDWKEDGEWSFGGMIYNSYEVIGNIYENPELLK